MRDARRMRRVAAALFAGIFLVQLAWAPLDLRPMGYSEDEVASSFLMIRWISGELEGMPKAELLGRHGLATVHGVVEPLVKLPFALAGRALAPLFPASTRFAERFIALLPLLETALLATLLFLWASRLARDPRWGLTAALGAAFCTLLWPYAYTGLEPTQGLVLFLAGYVALGADDEPISGRRRLGRTVGFVLLAALSIATKRTGLLLLPAVAYLVYLYFWRRSAPASRRRAALATGLSLLFVLAVHHANDVLRSGYYPPWSNGEFLRRFVEKNPVRLASHVLTLLFSGNKGLIVFAPAAALALTTLPAVWRRHRELAIFTLLVLSGLLAGYAVVGVPADETWGPRYLYPAIPLLLLCLSLAWGRRRLAAYRKAGLALALLLGFGVSALGTMFNYSWLFHAALRTRQATLEALWVDPVWNAVAMNLRLTRLWLAPPGTSTVWTPEHKWWYTQPLKAPPAKSIDLAFALQPQPLLLQATTRERPWLLGVLVACLVTGLAALAAAGRWAWRTPRPR
jgi:hypothetical protein